MRSVSCGSLPLVAAYSAGPSVVDGRCCGIVSCAGYSTGDRSFPGMRRASSMMQQLVFSYGALGVGTVSSIASCWSISPISMMGMLLEGGSIWPLRNNGTKKHDKKMKQLEKRIEEQGIQVSKPPPLLKRKLCFPRSTLLH